jgi:hypothetical protein
MAVKSRRGLESCALFVAVVFCLWHASVSVRQGGGNRGGFFKNSRPSRHGPSARNQA